MEHASGLADASCEPARAQARAADGQASDFAVCGERRRPSRLRCRGYAGDSYVVADAARTLPHTPRRVGPDDETSRP